MDTHFEFAPGDQVLVVPLGVVGFIVRSSIDRTGIAYMVDFWCESKRSTEWLYPHEVKEVEIK